MSTQSPSQQYPSLSDHPFSKRPCCSRENRHRVRLVAPAPLVLIGSLMAALMTGTLHASAATTETINAGATSIQPSSPEQQAPEQQPQQQSGQAGQDTRDVTDIIEEIMITGSRRARGSAADTPAPVDVISGQEFTDQAGANLSSLLRTLVPSYNVSAQPISDGGTFVRPANLRGLAPDQTLVLLNGKRRHRSAVIVFFWWQRGF